MTIRSLFASVARVLASRDLLLWMIALATLGYIATAFFAGEALGHVVRGLEEQNAVRISVAAFLAVALANVVRTSVSRVRLHGASALLAVVLPAGLWLYAAAFAGSYTFRDYMWVVVGRDQTVELPGLDAPVRVMDVSSPLAGAVSAEEPDSLIFVYEPTVRLLGPEGEVEVGVFPPVRAGPTWLGIMDFGLAPRVRLQRGRRTLVDGHMTQRLLPPGVSDEFTLEDHPYRFRLSLLHSTGLGGKISYDLADPAYRVVVIKGDEVVFEGDSTEPVLFDGYSLSFGHPTYWAWLQASRDPARIWLLLGLFLVGMGIPLWVGERLWRLTPGGRGQARVTGAVPASGPAPPPPSA